MTEMVKREFDMKPRTMIKELDLLRPIYKKTASYGHFGRELDEFTWEKTDLIEKLKNAV
jgi:S-adenosylmethionine synthetase